MFFIHDKCTHVCAVDSTDKTVFARFFTPAANQESVCNVFKQCGVIESCVVKARSNSLVLAYVTFSSSDSATKALSMNGSYQLGSRISVNPFLPHKSNVSIITQAPGRPPGAFRSKRIPYCSKEYHDCCRLHSDCARCYVSNLDESVNEVDIRNFFEGYLVSVSVVSVGRG